MGLCQEDQLFDALAALTLRDSLPSQLEPEEEVIDEHLAPSEAPYFQYEEGTGKKLSLDDVFHRPSDEFNESFMPVEYLRLEDQIQQDATDRRTSQYYADLHLSNQLSIGISDDDIVLSDLPDDVITQIISHLPRSDLAQVALVSKRFRQLVHEQVESNALIHLSKPKYTFLKSIYPFQDELRGCLWSSQKAYLHFLTHRRRLCVNFGGRLRYGIIRWIPKSDDRRTAGGKIKALQEACPRCKYWLRVGISLIQALSWPRDLDNLERNILDASPITLLIIRYAILYHEELQLQKYESVRESRRHLPVLEDRHKIRRQVTTALEIWCLMRGWMTPCNNTQREDFQKVWRAVRDRSYRNSWLGGDYGVDNLASTHGEIIAKLAPPHAPAPGRAPKTSQIGGNGGTAVRRERYESRDNVDLPLVPVSRLINQVLEGYFGEQGQLLTVKKVYDLIESRCTESNRIVIAAAERDAACWTMEKLWKLKEIGLKDSFDDVERGAEAYEGVTGGIYEDIVKLTRG